MKFFLFFISTLILGFYPLFAQEKKFVATREKMGSPFTIIFYADNTVNADSLINKCYRLVDSFVYIFSDYIDSSELNRLNASAGKGFFRCSPALYNILQESQKAFVLSKGAFDISLGPVIRLWRKARKTKQFPSMTEIAETRKRAGFDKVKLDAATQSVQLLQAGMQLDLGGIAQGYIASKVLTRLAAMGIKKALIDVSGDIATGEAPPGKAGWVIGINLPESEQLQKQQLRLSNKSVSTSGDIYQYLEYEGKRYSHIVDPKTGLGITKQKNVTVIADDALTADWLATACSILPIRRALKLCKKLGAEVLIAELKGAKIVHNKTKKFSYFYNSNNRIE